WGSDLRELLLRYGWPSGWERERDTGIPSLGPPSLISHYSNAPQDLLPPASALLAEGSAEGKWDVQSARSRTAYQVPLGDTIARWFFPLAHQHSVFRGSGEPVVVMAYELPSGSLPPDPRIE